MKKAICVFLSFLLFLTSGCSKKQDEPHYSDAEMDDYDYYLDGYEEGYVEGYMDALSMADMSYDDKLREVEAFIEEEYGFSLTKASAMMQENELYTKKQLVEAGYALSTFYHRMDFICFEDELAP